MWEPFLAAKGLSLLEPFFARIMELSCQLISLQLTKEMWESFVLIKGLLAVEPFLTRKME